MAVRRTTGDGVGWRECAGFLLLFGCLMALLALGSYDPFDVPANAVPPNRPVQNLIGLAGAWTAYGLYTFLGLAAWALVFGWLVWTGFFFFQRIGPVWPRGLWLLLLVGGWTMLLDLRPGITADWAQRLNLPSPGGIFGLWLGRRVMTPWFGELGALIFAATSLAAGLVFFLRISPYRVGRAVAHAVMRLWAGWQETRWRRMDRLARLAEAEKQIAQKRRTIEEALRRHGEIPDRVTTTPAVRSDPVPPPSSKSPDRPAGSPVAPTAPSASAPPTNAAAGASAQMSGADRPLVAPAGSAPVTTSAEPGLARTWTLPTTDLLEPLPPDADRVIVDDLQRSQQTLIETLADFGIEARITNVETGPVVTRYELLPAPGVRVEKIVSLSNNIGLSLKAESVRVLAPVPGKGVIGIEVPNPKTSVVFLREVVESEAWRATTAALPLALGKDVGGRVLIADLADMPHLLIAGATGSGKTVCMNSLLTGLLMCRTPDQLRLLLVDPKIVEFAAFRDLPHLVVPVITDAKKVAHGLRWAIQEMEARYKLFARAGVRNIRAFNSRAIARQPDLFGGVERATAGDLPERLPYIVIVVDELADLMLVAQAEIENQIARLAQLSRAVGIHMILATQRPSVDVITGTIKANFPARIAFQVAQKNDSRTILDANGADKLLGRGDMLFLPPGMGRLVRAQGCLVTDRDVLAVAEHWKRQGPPAYETGVVEKIEKKNAEIPDLEEDEELIEQAIEVIRQTRRASTSSLQRRLRIGYTRAARLMDLLEERGIVGPAQGSDPREILIDLDGEIPTNPAGTSGGPSKDETSQ
ncbi:MAG: DNA translocase FtsK [Kiritimatiellae bacterium]|nr:DNA translocase FtsK [Kiritimatiellia bacterium]